VVFLIDLLKESNIAGIRNVSLAFGMKAVSTELLEAHFARITITHTHMAHEVSLQVNKYKHDNGMKLPEFIRQI